MIASVQSDLVQETIRPIRVIRSVQRIGTRYTMQFIRIRDDLPGLGHPHIEQIDDLPAVDAERQRPSEAAISEQRAHHGILVGVVLIQIHGSLPRGCRLPAQYPVSATLAVLHQQRIIHELDPPALHIDLSGNGLERNRLRALHKRHFHPVDVGKLVPFRIHLPVIRVALRDEDGRIRSRPCLPSAKDRPIGIQKRIALGLV